MNPDTLKPTTWRLPIKLKEDLDRLAERMKPEIRNTSHMVELALRKWVEEHKEGKN